MTDDQSPNLEQIESPQNLKCSAGGCKYASEAALIPHYESHPSYYSPVPAVMPFLLNAFDVKIEQVRCALDLGCGDGRLTTWVARTHSIPTVGVDFSSRRIKIAVKSAEAAALPCMFYCKDLNFFLEDCADSFDLILAFEVLEHLRNPTEVLQRSRNLLGSEGAILGSVPVNMPYVAHLNVYKDEDDVRDQLKPDRVINKQRHWYCQWFR